MALVKCVNCGTENDPVKTAGFCDDCGKKLPGFTWLGLGRSTASSVSDGPQGSYDCKGNSSRAIRLSPEMRQARLWTVATLFTIAFLQFFGGCGLTAIYVTLQNGGFNSLQIWAALEIFAFGAIYLGLGIWGMSRPLIPAIVGLLVYLAHGALFTCGVIVLHAISNGPAPPGSFESGFNIGLMVGFLVRPVFFLAMLRAAWLAVAAR